MGTQGFAFEATINLGNLLTIISFLIGGLAFVYTLKGEVTSLKETVGVQSNRLTEVKTDFTTRLGEMEGELKNLVQVLVTQGKHDERMASMDARVSAQGARLDDLVKRFNYVTDNKELMKALEKS